MMKCDKCGRQAIRSAVNQPPQDQEVIRWGVFQNSDDGFDQAIAVFDLCRDCGQRLARTLQEAARHFYLGGMNNGTHQGG